MRFSFKRLILGIISYLSGIGFIVSVCTFDFIPLKYIWINIVVMVVTLLWMICFCWANTWKRKEEKDV